MSTNPRKPSEAALGSLDIQLISLALTNLVMAQDAELRIGQKLLDTALRDLVKYESGEKPDSKKSGAIEAGARFLKARAETNAARQSLIDLQKIISGGGGVKPEPGKPEPGSKDDITTKLRAAGISFTEVAEGVLAIDLDPDGPCPLHGGTGEKCPDVVVPVAPGSNLKN